MQPYRPSKHHSGRITKLAIAFIGIALVLAIIRDLKPSPRPSSEGIDRPGSLTAVSNSEVTTKPLATATLVPTATPLPKPTKKRDTPPPQLTAVGAVAIDDRSGAILFEKEAHLRRAPASITKIVTAIVAIEHASTGDQVTVSYDGSKLIDSTLMGVNPGDVISLEDLLYGLMLPSGNEAALAIANHIAGSEESFVNLMNAKMAEVGLRDSHFTNPHGLDASEHYSSAYDMAMIARYGMRYPLFRKLSSAKSHVVTLWRAGEKLSYEIYNLNRLLWIYPGADGVKIGFTENALRTIVGSAARDGHRVFVTLMGSVDLWTDTPKLLDYAFDNYSWPATD